MFSCLCRWLCLAGAETFAAIAILFRDTLKNSIIPLLCSLAAQDTTLGLLDPYEQLVNIGEVPVPLYPFIVSSFDLSASAQFKPQVKPGSKLSILFKLIINHTISTLIIVSSAGVLCLVSLAVADHQFCICVVQCFRQTALCISTQVVT